MSKRIVQVNELIRRELGNIILKEGSFSKNTIVTITRVDTSIDLSSARVYISILPEQEAKNVLIDLNRDIYHIQQKINKIFSMKRVPKIRFVQEKETRKAAEIDELLDKIRE